MEDKKAFNEDEINNRIREDRFLEEAGAEIAPTRPEIFPERDRTDHDFEVRDLDVDGEREGTGLGIAALILSILSLLSIMPVILGIAGIVTGMIAYRRGSTGLAIWSMVIAVISLINQFFIAPFIT